MKIAVLGATGGTGRLIVAEAQRQGDAVRALVRSSAKANELGAAELVIGDASSEADVDRLIDGCDAVISALGTPLSPFSKVTLLSTATRALVAAMDRHDVRRLVCITGVGAGDSRGHGGFLYDRLILPLLLRNVYADKDRQEAIVRASDLDWTLVRPTVLNDKPATRNVTAITDLTGFHGGTIPRADVARFVVDQVTSDRWLRATPVITAA